MQPGTGLPPLSPAEGSINPVATVSVANALDEHIAATWRELERSGLSTPYQSLDWYAAWLNTVAGISAETPLIILARDGTDRATLLLPLVLSSRSPVRIAKFAGDKHSNFNLPLLCSGVAFTPADVARLFDLTALLRPDIDLFVLDALPRTWGGIVNPLVGPAARMHTAQASVLILNAEPKSQDTTNLTAERRRKLRRNDRKFESFGVRLQRATSTAEIDRALGAFVAHKIPWFLARGLPNSFGQPRLVEFFADLVSRPNAGAEIYCLTAPDERIIAVAAILATSRRASLMFVSFDAASPYAAFSPGLKLVREIVKEASRHHLSEFDFGLGEAPYKDSLGAGSQQVFVDIRPLTAKGSFAATIIEGRRRSKIFLKQHPTFLATLMRLRRYFSFWTDLRCMFARVRVR